MSNTRSIQNLPDFIASCLGLDDIFHGKNQHQHTKYESYQESQIIDVILKDIFNHVNEIATRVYGFDNLLRTRVRGLEEKFFHTIKILREQRTYLSNPNVHDYGDFVLYESSLRDFGFYDPSHLAFFVRTFSTHVVKSVKRNSIADSQKEKIGILAKFCLLVIFHVMSIVNAFETKIVTLHRQELVQVLQQHKERFPQTSPKPMKITLIDLIPTISYNSSLPDMIWNHMLLEDMDQVHKSIEKLIRKDGLRLRLDQIQERQSSMYIFPIVWFHALNGTWSLLNAVSDDNVNRFQLYAIHAHRNNIKIEQLWTQAFSDTNKSIYENMKLPQNIPTPTFAQPQEYNPLLHSQPSSSSSNDHNPLLTEIQKGGTKISTSEKLESIAAVVRSIILGGENDSQLIKQIDKLYSLFGEQAKYKADLIKNLKNHNRFIAEEILKYLCYSNNKITLIRGLVRDEPLKRMKMELRNDQNFQDHFDAKILEILKIEFLRQIYELEYPRIESVMKQSGADPLRYDTRLEQPLKKFVKNYRQATLSANSRSIHKFYKTMFPGFADSVPQNIADAVISALNSSSSSSSSSKVDEDKVESFYFKMIKNHRNYQDETANSDFVKLFVMIRDLLEPRSSGSAEDGKKRRRLIQFDINDQDRGNVIEYVTKAFDDYDKDRSDIHSTMGAGMALAWNLIWKKHFSFPSKRFEKEYLLIQGHLMNAKGTYDPNASDFNSTKKKFRASIDAAWDQISKLQSPTEDEAMTQFMKLINAILTHHMMSFGLYAQDDDETLFPSPPDNFDETQSPSPSSSSPPSSSLSSPRPENAPRMGMLQTTKRGQERKYPEMLDVYILEIMQIVRRNPSVFGVSRFKMLTENLEKIWQIIWRDAMPKVHQQWSSLDKIMTASLSFYGIMGQPLDQTRRKELSDIMKTSQLQKQQLWETVNKINQTDAIELITKCIDLTIQFENARVWDIDMQTYPQGYDPQYLSPILESDPDAQKFYTFRDQLNMIKDGNVNQIVNIVRPIWNMFWNNGFDKRWFTETFSKHIKSAKEFIEKKTNISELQEMLQDDVSIAKTYMEELILNYKFHNIVHTEAQEMLSKWMLSECLIYFNLNQIKSLQLSSSSAFEQDDDGDAIMGDSEPQSIPQTQDFEEEHEARDTQKTPELQPDLQLEPQVLSELGSSEPHELEQEQEQESQPQTPEPELDIASRSNPPTPPTPEPTPPIEPKTQKTLELQPDLQPESQVLSELGSPEPHELEQEQEQESQPQTPEPELDIASRSNPPTPPTQKQPVVVVEPQTLTRVPVSRKPIQTFVPLRQLGNDEIQKMMDRIFEMYMIVQQISNPLKSSQLAVIIGEVWKKMRSDSIRNLDRLVLSVDKFCAATFAKVNIPRFTADKMIEENLSQVQESVLNGITDFQSNTNDISEIEKIFESILTNTIYLFAARERQSRDLESSSLPSSSVESASSSPDLMDSIDLTANPLFQDEENVLDPNTFDDGSELFSSPPPFFNNNNNDDNHDENDDTGINNNNTTTHNEQQEEADEEQEYGDYNDQSNRMSLTCGIKRQQKQITACSTDFEKVTHSNRFCSCFSIEALKYICDLFRATKGRRRRAGLYRHIHKILKQHALQVVFDEFDDVKGFKEQEYNLIDTDSEDEEDTEDTENTENIETNNNNNKNKKKKKKLPNSTKIQRRKQVHYVKVALLRVISFIIATCVYVINKTMHLESTNYFNLQHDGIMDRLLCDVRSFSLCKTIPIENNIGWCGVHLSALLTRWAHMHVRDHVRHFETTTSILKTEDSKLYEPEYETEQFEQRVVEMISSPIRFIPKTNLTLMRYDPSDVPRFVMRYKKYQQQQASEIQSDSRRMIIPFVEQMDAETCYMYIGIIKHHKLRPGIHVTILKSTINAKMNDFSHPSQTVFTQSVITDSQDSGATMVQMQSFDSLVGNSTIPNEMKEMIDFGLLVLKNRQQRHLLKNNPKQNVSYYVYDKISGVSTLIAIAEQIMDNMKIHGQFNVTTHMNSKNRLDRLLYIGPSPDEVRAFLNNGVVETMLLRIDRSNVINSQKQIFGEEMITAGDESSLQKMLSNQSNQSGTPRQNWINILEKQLWA